MELLCRGGAEGGPACESDAHIFPAADAVDPTARHDALLQDQAALLCKAYCTIFPKPGAFFDERGELGEQTKPWR